MKYFCLGCLIISSVSLAKPNLQTVETIEGVKIFQDHLNPTTFYYQKLDKEIVHEQATPKFSYHLNRYIGTSITEDQDQYRVRGAIKFQTKTVFAEQSYQKIKRFLTNRQNKDIKLLPAPVTHSFHKLIYQTVIENDEENTVSGEIEGGKVIELTKKKQIYGTDKKSHTIGLSGHNADFFWENFERDNLVLSLSFGWSVAGVVKSTEDEWQESTYDIGNSIPIQVSMKKFPELFSKNELWQKVDIAHSTITVMCYDFINIEKSNLFRVTVDLKFSTIRDQVYKESVKFTENSDLYEQKVRFKLVNSIKEGYEYRVTRMTLDGDKIVTDWTKSTQPAIDVSLSVEDILKHQIIEEESVDES